jgi:small subunit ribosomal protein S2
MGSFGLEPLINKSYLPDLVVFLNPSEAAHGVRECTLRNVPTVGIIDSDTDPRMVTYPIPANAQVSKLLE